MRIVVHGQQAFGKGVLEALLNAARTSSASLRPRPSSGRPRRSIEGGRARPGSPRSPAADVSQQARSVGRVRSAEGGLCVMAYVTLIVPEEVLNQPTRGTIQYHPLCFRAIAGQLDQLADHHGARRKRGSVSSGPTRVSIRGRSFQKEVEIRDSDTLGSLYFDRLYPLGVAALLEGVDLVRAGTARRSFRTNPQRPEGWCKKEHVQIDWRSRSDDLNLIRGADPQPGAWTTHEERPCRSSTRRSLPGHTRPAGEVLAIDDAGMTVAVAGGQIQVSVCGRGRAGRRGRLRQDRGCAPRTGGEVSDDGPPDSRAASPTTATLTSRSTCAAPSRPRWVTRRPCWRGPSSASRSRRAASITATGTFPS